MSVEINLSDNMVRVIHECLWIMQDADEIEFGQYDERVSNIDALELFKVLLATVDSLTDKQTQPRP